MFRLSRSQFEELQTQGRRLGLNIVSRLNVGDEHETYTVYTIRPRQEIITTKCVDRLKVALFLFSKGMG
jgi:hypothetical protein